MSEGANQNSNPPASGAGGGTSPPASPPRPDWVPKDFHDGDSGWKVEDFGRHYGELATFKAESDERLKGVPAKPEDVKLELPKELKFEGLPPDAKIEIDEKDPRIAAFRDFVVANKLTQEQASGLLAIEAQRVADQAIADAAEFKKLGDKGTERVTSVDKFLKSFLPTAKYEALRSSGDLRTAAAIELIEDLQAKLAGAGAPPRPQDPPAPPQQKTLAQRMYPNLPSAAATRAR